MQGHQCYQPKLFTHFDLEDFVEKDHFLRKVDKAIDLSFIRELTAELYCSDNGRRSIDPETFFRIVLVGILYGISSDRKLAKDIHYNLAYRWFCRLNLEDKVPDHSSLTRIRDRLGEEVFEKIFHRVVEICREKGLLKGKKLAIDASLFRANASMDVMISKETGLAEPRNFKQGATKVGNKTHFNKTDPDSSMSNAPGGGKGLFYKLHSAVDGDHRVIVDAHVTTGKRHEAMEFINQMERIDRNFHFDLEEVLADKGYGSVKNHAYLREKNIEAFIPLFSSRSGALLRKKGLTYDRATDSYTCLAGEKLVRESEKMKYNQTFAYRTRGGPCLSCQWKNECEATHRTGTDRYVQRSAHSDFYEEIREKAKTDLFIQRKYERLWLIEGSFAEAKNWHGHHKARYRGRSKVQIQAYLTATVQNIKRIVSASILSFIGDLKGFMGVLAAQGKNRDPMKFWVPKIFFYLESATCF